MNKRGQFYIFAAIIIIAVVIGIAAITNYARTKPKPARLYDLGKELNLETGNVIDYGIYKPEITDLDSLIKNWAQQYVEYAESQTGKSEWLFVYGNEDKVTILTFSKETTGTINVCYNSGCVGLILEGEEMKEGSIAEPGDNVEVDVFGTNYSFKVNEGENFYFVLNASEGVIVT